MNYWDTERQWSPLLLGSLTLWEWGILSGLCSRFFIGTGNLVGGKNMVNSSWGFINFIKAVNILLGYTGGRKTTENFCTWILFLTLLSFSFIKNSRDCPFQMSFIWSQRTSNCQYLLWWCKQGVINANKLFTLLDFSECAF